MNKLKSRKFWISVASILASIGTAIAGINSDNQIIVMVGIICAVASGAIYEVCESMIDAERVYEEEFIIETDDVEGGE